MQIAILAKLQAASTYQITIIGTGMAQIGPDEYEGGQTIELYVSKGLQRLFYLERYNSDGDLTDSGSFLADIGSGINDISKSQVQVVLVSTLLMPSSIKAHPQNSVSYQCVVSNSAGRATSDTVVIYVNDIMPQITL